jgi:hypothetical protein
MASFAGEIDIKSRDIDRSMFSEENFRALKGQFPNCTDETIARYLIARNNDLDKATELLTKAELWRSKQYPILKQDCIGEFRKGKIYTHGFDKEGRPLYIVRAANHDPSDRDIEELAKCALWWAELVCSRLPDDKTKYTILIDRTDAGVRNQDIEFSRNFSKLFQDQYPERLNKAIVYPSGVMFWSLWNLIKWFFDPVTRNKVNPVMMLSGVREFIDDEYIPASMVSLSLFSHKMHFLKNLTYREERQLTNSTLMTSKIHILQS